MKLSSDEALAVKGLGLITIKPMIYVANVPEDDLADKGANNTHVKVCGCKDEGTQLIKSQRCADGTAQMSIAYNARVQAS